MKGLRALSISTVINAVANAEETLGFSRHTSVTAQKPYHRANHTSEMAKFRALGVVRDPRFDTRVLVDGGPSSVVVRVGDAGGTTGAPAAAAAQRQGELRDKRCLPRR